MDDEADRSRGVPTGRIGRLARLAALGARTGAGLVTNRDPAALAERAADVLGSMRGLAAKVGQMASYVDGMVPETGSRAVEEALASLRAATTSSPPEAIRRTIEEELGAPIDRLFARFDDRPFASASIGQVHRALLEDGREVAVKVQHPGIEQAVASDLDNVGVIQGIVGAAAGAKVGAPEIYREVRRRFEEELDYRHEAAQTRLFREIAAAHPSARVPEVIDARSSRRVLTTELARGRALDEAALASGPEREAWARTLWGFTFDSVLGHGRFNADPHPGNFLFQDDGRVVFLDFGCVQPLGDEPRAAARAMHRAAAARDEGTFRTSAARMLATRGGRYEDVVVGYARRSFEPLFASPFRMTRPFVASVVQGIQDMKREVFFSKDASTVPLPPSMVLMNRLQFGFYSVLARLDVEVDYVGVERPILARLA